MRLVFDVVDELPVLDWLALVEYQALLFDFIEGPQDVENVIVVVVIVGEVGVVGSPHGFLRFFGLHLLLNSIILIGILMFLLILILIIISLFWVTNRIDIWRIFLRLFTPLFPLICFPAFLCLFSSLSSSLSLHIFLHRFFYTLILHYLLFNFLWLHLFFFFIHIFLFGLLLLGKSFSLHCL